MVPSATALALCLALLLACLTRGESLVLVSISLLAGAEPRGSGWAPWEGGADREGVGATAWTPWLGAQPSDQCFGAGHGQGSLLIACLSLLVGSPKAQRGARAWLVRTGATRRGRGHWGHSAGLGVCQQTAAARETCKGKVADVTSEAFLPGDNTAIRQEV